MSTGQSYTYTAVFLPTGERSVRTFHGTRVALLILLNQWNQQGGSTWKYWTL